MKISEAKQSYLTGTTQSLFEAISQNLACLHATTAAHRELLQRVAALQAAFLLAEDDEEIGDIVQAWQNVNSEAFNHKLQNDLFGFGIDTGRQARIYHQIKQVVEQMLDNQPVGNEADSNTSISHKPKSDLSSSPRLAPVGGRTAWLNSVTSLGGHLSTAAVRQPTPSLYASLVKNAAKPTAGLKEPLL